MKQPDKPLRLLVVGSGGREHALAALCQRSPYAASVIVAPGNGGMAHGFRCFPVGADDVAGLVDLAEREAIDLVVVGPEVPLNLGLTDALAEKGIAVFGPRADGARLEGSKIFTKELLQKHGIPTARARWFADAGEALAYVRGETAPMVVKADGLAAGKGVTVAATVEEAESAVRAIMEEKVFGESGARILIEECMTGEEASIHVLVSGRDYAILPTSQDHKRIGEGDTGPNTGGMGAYSPAELVTDELLREVEEIIVRPSVEAVAAEGMDFRGVLYIGIMVTPDGPKVMEYNVRFGDPETQVILPRLQTDLVHLLHACAHGYLNEVPVKVKPEHALCVVIAAKGYPGDYPKGEPISLPEEMPGESFVYHAGTALDPDGDLVSNGGRVLGVTSLAPTLRQAAEAAYGLCAKIAFASKVYRRDIGAKQLTR